MSEPTQPQKTHWKKNLDTRYIAGEDLKSGLNGLSPEMIVYIDRHNDGETFDQNTQTKKAATILYLKESATNKPLYKPVVLNTTNAKFFIKETGSEFVEDWVGRPVIMYAQKDSRHGHVVRFKKYIKPTLYKDTPDFLKCYNAIHKNNYTMDQIRTRYEVSSDVEKLLMTKPVSE